MRRDPNRERVSVYAPTKFRAIAAKEKRSVSNLVFKILSDYVEGRSVSRLVPQSHIKSQSAAP
jgi:hypothetical protein